MHRIIVLFVAAIFCCNVSQASAWPNQLILRYAAFPSKIRHVVIIVQENRSTDNLFHGLPGADTVSSGLNSFGQKIPLASVSMTADYGVDHSHRAFIVSYDKGAMDGFNLESENCSVKPCPTNGAYAYVPESEVTPYFALAEQYTFADRMFQTNEGPSYPAHQYLMSGTSEPSVGSDLLASENPELPNRATGGACDSPAGTTEQMITPSGDEHTRMFPCFEHATLPDLLDGAGYSWRYYAPSVDGIWDAPSSIQHIRFGSDWKNIVIPPTNVLSDIANNQLADVSWVIPDGRYSDHPGGQSGAGPSWVASIVNAIGQGRYWKSTAIFITWDDWGGWYDHVQPYDLFNIYEVGFRVPLIVVSPYARPGYVSHVNHQFGSILHFIEQNYGLASLGFADKRSDDLSDCFNFSQSPLKFHTIDAPLSPQWFTRLRGPAFSPDDD